MPKKLITLNELKKKLKKLRNTKKIAFTNGCFDILHSGHIKLLINSKKRSDVLIVGLNSDKSYFKVKNKKPLYSFRERALILSQVHSIDFIVKLDDINPKKLINNLKPDLHCKGGDYKEKKLEEYNLLKRLKIKIYIMPIKGKKISSSKIIL